MVVNDTGRSLAGQITKKGSLQTFLTIRTLVDRDLTIDAYRAYGYFRWVDDQLDGEGMNRSDRLAFINRQRNLLDGSYQRVACRPLSIEEQMLTDLIRSDQGQASGLRSYLTNMMAVMEFDALRRDRLINSRELAEYTQHLAVAVTDAMHYFIGRYARSPRNRLRYLAVTGAHITHMLRDTLDDIRNGYFNIPMEYLEAHKISPFDIDKPHYRNWVMNRVQRARACFRAGKEYFSGVESWRCRMAGHAYTVRFERILGIIERDDYYLRTVYSPALNPLHEILKVVPSMTKPLNPWTAKQANSLPLRVPNGGKF